MARKSRYPAATPRCILSPSAWPLRTTCPTDPHPAAEVPCSVVGSEVTRSPARRARIRRQDSPPASHLESLAYLREGNIQDFFFFFIVS